MSLPRLDNMGHSRGGVPGDMLGERGIYLGRGGMGGFMWSYWKKGDLFGT